MQDQQRQAILADPFTLAYVGTMLQDAENNERDAAAEEERAPRVVPTAHTLVGETLQSCADDCAEFKRLAGPLLPQAQALLGYGAYQAGSDFWLTRVGHGAGFWDRGLGVLGEQLTALCGHGTGLGTVDPYLDSDGQVYL